MGEVDGLEPVSVTQTGFDGVDLALSRVVYRSCEDGGEDWALMHHPGGPEDWVIVLHGHGSDGSQLFTRKDIREGWLPAIQDRGLGILCPNLRGNSWMSPAAAQDLAGLIGWLRRAQGARRVIVTGGSMGGTGALAFAGLYPGLVDGVVALCPAGDVGSYLRWCETQNQPPVLAQIAQAIRTAYGAGPEETPELYQKHSALHQARKLRMPVTIAAAQGDAVIPVAQSRLVAQALSGRMTFRYLEFPEGNHDTALIDYAQGLTWVLIRLGRQ